MTLSTSDIKEGEKIDMRRRRSIARSSICIHNLVSNRRGRLRFVLTPQWAAGHRFIGMADDEATMDKSLGLFLLPRGRPRPCFSITAPAYRLITSASAIRRSASQEENHRRDLKGEDDAVEETYSGRFRVSLGKPGPLIYKVHFMGLYKLKVQLNYGL
jgi:hypothetical protein